MEIKKSFNWYLLFMFITFIILGIILKIISPEVINIFCVTAMIITWGLILGRYLFCSCKISHLLKGEKNLSEKYTYQFMGISILKRYAENSPDIRNNSNMEIQKYVSEISSLGKYLVYAIIVILVLLSLNFI